MMYNRLIMLIEIFNIFVHFLRMRHYKEGILTTIIIKNIYRRILELVNGNAPDVTTSTWWRLNSELE